MSHQHIEYLRQQNRKITMSRIDVDLSLSNAERPERAHGNERLPPLQHQLQTQPEHHLRAILPLLSTLPRPCSNAGRLMDQSDLGLNLVPVLASRPAGSSGTKRALRLQSLVAEGGWVHWNSLQRLRRTSIPIKNGPHVPPSHDILKTMIK